MILRVIVFLFVVGGVCYATEPYYSPEEIRQIINSDQFQAMEVGDVVKWMTRHPQPSHLDLLTELYSRYRMEASDERKILKFFYGKVLVANYTRKKARVNQLLESLFKKPASARELAAYELIDAHNSSLSPLLKESIEKALLASVQTDKDAIVRWVISGAYFLYDSMELIESLDEALSPIAEGKLGASYSDQTRWKEVILPSTLFRLSLVGSDVFNFLSDDVIATVPVEKLKKYKNRARRNRNSFGRQANCESLLQ